MNYQIPPFQPQSSPPFDASSCSNEATIGCIEMIRGNFQEFSVSGAAVISGTTPSQGNDIQDVINAYNQYGLISYTTRPLSPVFNQQQYYTPITVAQWASANKTMKFTLVAPDLNISPIILRLKLANTYHFVVTKDKINYIDSYQPQIKPIDWSIVVGQWSLLIQNKTATSGYQVAGNPTVYVEVGDKLVPLRDWQAFLNIGGSQSSISIVTQSWLDSMAVIGNDFFGSN